MICTVLTLELYRDQIFGHSHGAHDVATLLTENSKVVGNEDRIAIAVHVRCLVIGGAVRVEDGDFRPILLSREHVAGLGGDRPCVDVVRMASMCTGTWTAGGGEGLPTK